MSSPYTETTPATQFRFFRFAGPAFLLLLVVVVYGDTLFASPMPVVSAENGDGHRYFSVSRAFGFGELRHGNLPLWNPHVFAGVPFLPGIQSALFYPVNAIYFVLPLPAAMNLDLLFHLWWLGVGAYAWARGHGVGPAPATLTGAMCMFAAPYFLHTWPGHFTLLAAYAWAPFFFRAIDCALDRPTLRETALGIVAVTMMILAGYPQAAYSCALIAVIYIFFQLPILRVRPIAKLSALAALAILPALLAAAQLGPTAEFAAESVRAHGVDRADSFEYSLLPHHLIRALAPGFFGGTADTPFWGGGFPLETGVFLGRIGILLALAGCLISHKIRAPVIAIVLVAGALALGPHTAAAPFFHKWIPGFDIFRAPGRYWMFVAWFIALISGIAVQRLHNLNFKRRWLRYSALTAALAAWPGYLWIAFSVRNSGPDSNWTLFVDSARGLNEDSELSLEQALNIAAGSAPTSVLATAVVLSAFAALCWAPMSARWRTFGIVALGCLEMTAFARAHRQTFDSALLHAPQIAAYDSSRKIESRVLNLANDNEAMRAGAYDISGYEPGMLYRFDRFLSHPGAHLFDRREDGVLAGNAIASMLRCAAVVDSRGQIVQSESQPLRRFTIVTNFEVIPSDDELLDRLFDPEFDPNISVLLGVDPGIGSHANAAGTFVHTLRGATTDHVSLIIDVPHGGLLLCTDSYSAGWRARPLPESVQQKYEIIPANYVMRAIPLQPGRHNLTMYYAPKSFRPGMWLSILSATILNILLIRSIYTRIRHRLRRHTDHPE